MILIISLVLSIALNLIWLFLYCVLAYSYAKEKTSREYMQERLQNKQKKIEQLTKELEVKNWKRNRS